MNAAGWLGRRGLLLGGAAASGAAVAGCAPEAAAPVQTRLGPNRTGYLSISAPIVPRLRDLFIQDANTLIAAGAKTIYVLIRSPGGVVPVAQEMIGFMDRTHVERGIDFTMHSVGGVASAACYVFLAAQNRYADPGSAFLFHEASLSTSGGSITSQRLQEASTEVQAIERGFMDMLRRKTRLTEGELSSFVRRTVILDAVEARRDGLVDRVEGFTLPPGATVFHISSTPPNRPAAERSVPNG